MSHLGGMQCAHGALLPEGPLESLFVYTLLLRVNAAVYMRHSHLSPGNVLGLSSRQSNGGCSSTSETRRQRCRQTRSTSPCLTA